MSDDEVINMLTNLLSNQSDASMDVPVPVTGKSVQQFSMLACNPTAWINPPADNPYGLVSCPIHIKLNYGAYDNIDAAILVDRNGNYRFGTDFWTPSQFDEHVKAGNIVILPDQNQTGERYLILPTIDAIKNGIELYANNVANQNHNDESWDRIMNPATGGNSNDRYAFMIAVTIGEFMSQQFGGASLSPDYIKAYDITSDAGASMLIESMKRCCDVVDAASPSGTTQRFSVRNHTEMAYVIFEMITVIENLMFADRRFNKTYMPLPLLNIKSTSLAQSKKHDDAAPKSGVEDAGAELLRRLSEIRI